MNVIFLTFTIFAAFGSLEAWGSSSSKVKLTDVKALTLRHGQMTTGRRSNPVPQLHCVGGTAGCTAFTPQVIQCYNRGSDGYDVQWECKSDMDNAYRFGRTDVVCEGYDYADDPYILKGSCGVEYTIDLTEEGLKRKGQSHNYYGDSHSYKANFNTQSSPKSSSLLGNSILLIILILFVLALFKMCTRNYQYSPTDDDFSNPSPGFGGFGTRRPPPPGFRDDYNSGGYGDCSSNMGAAGAGNNGSGFWTGAATGGILGYMFGNSNRSRYGYERPYAGSNSGSWGGFSSGGSGQSTGTRTASGFGGTRRR